MRPFVVFAMLTVPVIAHGQNPPAPPAPTQTQTQAHAEAQTPAPAQEEVRPTGLPSKLKWTFNLDAGWGSFGFQNSLFNNPKEGVDENLSDQWFEGYAKPALTGTYTGDEGGTFYGKVSAVGERTYGSAPALVGEDISSFQVEDLHVGWRSGKTFENFGEDAVDVTVGRAQYRLGHGFLLFDGAAEGGSRGGYWTNARKAFEFAAIGRFKPGAHTAEVFYLDKDELPENDSGTRLWGVNYEYAIGETSTFGASFLKFYADEAFRPERDGLNVFNLRAFTAPIPDHPDLSFELEWALEDNGDALDSNAWTAQGAYQLSGVVWKPKFSYRYAFFKGDDPTTLANEAFDPLLLGFYDWGQWWQGEIAGEYFLSNSNLISHMGRAHFTPTDAIGTGLQFYNFKLDEPATFAPGVTDDDLAIELDWYMDWKLNANFTLSLLAAWADPGRAAQQAFDRTKSFTYGMVYLAYAY